MFHSYCCARIGGAGISEQVIQTLQQRPPHHGGLQIYLSVEPFHYLILFVGIQLEGRTLVEQVVASFNISQYLRVPIYAVVDIGAPDK